MSKFNLKKFLLLCLIVLISVFIWWKFSNKAVPSIWDIPAQVKSDWTTCYQSNIQPSMPNGLNDTMPVNISGLNNFISSTSGFSKFHFGYDNKGITLVIEHQNNKKYIDVNTGNLIDNKSYCDSLILNYKSQILPLIKTTTSHQTQTEYICVDNNEFKSNVIGKIDTNKTAFFELAQICNSNTNIITNPIIKQFVDLVIQSCSSQMTVILNAQDSLGNSLYFDASHTYPPGSPNCQ